MERLKTMKNWAETSLVLIDAKRDDLLPTVLEQMYQDMQGIIDDYCIKEVGDES